MREASRRVAQRIQASDVGTGSESGIASTGVGDHRETAARLILIPCGNFFAPLHRPARFSLDVAVDLAGIPDSFCGFVAAERWARATALSRNCADKPRESSRLCCLWRILSVRQPARVQDTTTGEGIPGPGSRR
jgi:hypothetical protein